MSSQRLTNPASIDADLADYLDRDDDFRRQYIKSFAQAAVAAEIKGLRKLRRLKQADVARLVKTGQSAISRIEKADYDGWTFKTLLAIAVELKAQLSITLKPIEDVTGQMRAVETGIAGRIEDSADTLDSASMNDDFSTPFGPPPDGSHTAYEM